MFPSSKKDFLFITTYTLSLSLSLSFQASSVQRRLVRQWSGVESPLALIFQATLARHCQTCPKVSCWPHCWSSKLPKVVSSWFCINTNRRPLIVRAPQVFTEKEVMWFVKSCDWRFVKSCDWRFAQILHSLGSSHHLTNCYLDFPMVLPNSTNLQIVRRQWCLDVQVVSECTVVGG